jgi:hypothetical protein
MEKHMSGWKYPKVGTVGVSARNRGHEGIWGIENTDADAMKINVDVFKKKMLSTKVLGCEGGEIEG